MKKLYFWGCQDTRETDGKLRIMRFRFEAERAAWIQNAEMMPSFGMPPLNRFAIDAQHPLWSEIRRIKRRLASGESLTFPVEIE